MSIKRILSLCVAVLFGFAVLPSYSQDIISCNGFESCPEADTSALEARIEALEALLAGATRGIDPSTSQDTLSFGNSTSSDTIVGRELSTTDREGDFPVCFNGAGELLPCADGVEPPPPVDPYVGSWTGRMIYDRRSTGTCYDADVILNVVEWSSSTYDWRVNSTTVIRDSGGLAISNYSLYIPDTGFTVGDINVFGVAINVNLQFNTNGTAEGYWDYASYETEDCYGTWSFTKD